MTKEKKDPRRYFKQLRFQQLQGFIEISKSRNFTIAAKALRVSVPTLWHQIKSLEEQFAAKLIHKTRGQVELTAEGVRLCDLCRPIVSEFELLKERFEAKRSGKTKQINLFTSYLTVSSELTDALTNYRLTHPDIQLSLVEASSQDAILAVQEGRCDFAVVRLAEIGNLPNQTTLKKYPLALVAPENHPLIRIKTPTLDDLKTYPFVLPGRDTETRRIIEKVFADKSIAPIIAFEGNNLEMLLSHASQVDTVCIIPKTKKTELMINKIFGDKFHMVDLSHLFGYELLILLEGKNQSRDDYLCAFPKFIVEAFEAI